MAWQVLTQHKPTVAQRNLRPGLEARLHDPLWLLARQRQMGEFFGEDAGSPVKVEVEADAFPADRVVLGGQALPYSAEVAPLEALVEREAPTRSKPDLRIRAQWGMLFLDYLDRAGLPYDRARLAGRFAVPEADRAPPPPSTPWRGCSRCGLWTASDPRALCGRPDRRRHAAGSVPGGRRAAPAGVPRRRSDLAGARGRHRRRGAVRRLVRRADGVPFEVWVPTDNGRVTLSAPEYHGGRLDWDAFASAPWTASSAAAPQRTRTSMLAAQ